MALAGLTPPKSEKHRTCLGTTGQPEAGMEPMGQGNDAQHRIAALLVKRSKARGTLGLWDDALKDADQTIKILPSSPWGYERRHAALHALRRYEEAIDAFSRMFSLIEESPDEELRQLAKKYIAPSVLVASIDKVIRRVSKTLPFVLIDVESGRLCDVSERSRTFKSESQFKELLSSMTEEIDDRRIQQMVDGYFRYVALSHVWQGREPSYQDVMASGSVWELHSSPLNDKLHKFCEVVHSNGYRWGWCDTCCIDKSATSVVNQSLVMMYKWWGASAAAFVFLADVPTSGNLKDSLWLTRSWTLQELLAPKVIRFYTHDWQPYLGDTPFNHKESAKILSELADAMDITPDTITTFNPDRLSTREKLRLASTRSATIVEDIAYSLIGIFNSDILPRYGENEAALGHLLEETMAHSGDLTVLDWTGESSSYNSCLPATLAVYNRPPLTSHSIDDVEMDACVVSLRASLPPEDVMLIYTQVTALPSVRFGDCRLLLPCITFAVKKVSLLKTDAGTLHYRAVVSELGQVEFQTSDRLSIAEPRGLIFIHPWIPDLCDRPDARTWGSIAKDNDDDYTLALQLVVRLQQPFHALLLQKEEVSGAFKRVAADREIVVAGVQISSEFAWDIQTRMVQVV